MEKNILNFHFDYLHPSLSDWPWWDLIDATLIVEVDVETDADFAVADSLHCFFSSFRSLLLPIWPQLDHSLTPDIQFSDSSTIWREFCGDWLNQRNSTSCLLRLWQCFYLFRRCISFDPKSHKVRMMSNKLSRCIIWPGAAADYNCCSVNVRLANPVLP